MTELTTRQWKLILLQVHFGILKYDSAFKVLLHELIWQIELKARVLQQVTAHLLPDDTRNGLVANKRVSEKITHSKGFDLAIAATKSWLLKRERVVLGSCQLAARERMAGVLEEQAARAEQVEAGRAIELDIRRAEFSGKIAEVRAR